MISKTSLAVLFLFGGAFLAIAAPTSREEDLDDEDLRYVEKCFEQNGLKVDRSPEYLKKHKKEITACFMQSPSHRPALAFEHLAKYVKENTVVDEDDDDSKFIDICSFWLKPNQYGNDTVVDTFDDEEENFFTYLLDEQNMDFCELAFNKVIPFLCAIREDCTSEEMDFSFALFYVAQQVSQEHPKAFTCNSSEQNEFLNGIINPALYTTKFNYDVEDFLTKPLKCEGKKLGNKTGKDKKRLRISASSMKAMNSLTRTVGESKKKLRF